VLFLFSRHILQIDVLASALPSFNLIVNTRIIFKSLNEFCKTNHFQECLARQRLSWRQGHCHYSCIWKLPRLFEIDLLRFPLYYALASVIHPDWLIGSNVRLRVSEILISTSKNVLTHALPLHETSKRITFIELVQTWKAVTFPLKFGSQTLLFP